MIIVSNFAFNTNLIIFKIRRLKSVKSYKIADLVVMSNHFVKIQRVFF